MANRDHDHLSDDDLLLFLDGEVDRADEAAIRAHLAACWSCRVRGDELQATIATVVRAMDEVIVPEVPPPPGPWDGLEPHFARLATQLDAERRVVRWRAAVTRTFRTSRMRWVAAAVTTVVVALAFLQQRPVTATELLARARPVEQLTAHRQLMIEERDPTGRIVTRRRVEVWQNTATREKARRLYDERQHLIAGEWTRTDGSRVIYRRGEGPLREDGPSALSATTENIWRLDLAASTFSRVAADPHRVVVEQQSQRFVLSLSLVPAADRDVKPGASLSSVFLTLSKTELHPIAQRFTFGTGAGARTFDVVETTFSEVPASAFPVAAFVPERELTGALVEVPVAPTKPAPVVRRLTSEESLGLEVEAIVRLDRVGALVGEQVSVTRAANGRLRIDALVDTPARKAELTAALEPLAPRWAVDVDIQTFEEAQQRAPAPQQEGTPAVRSVEITNPRAPVYDDLERYFAEGADAEAQIGKEIQGFTGRVLEHSLQARLHARALTQAVARVSARELQVLAPERAQAWRALLREHAAALGRETEALRVALQPVFFPTPPEPQTQAAPTDSHVEIWSAVARLFELASAHDATVGQAFTVSAQGATATYLESDEFWGSLRSAEALAERLRSAVAASPTPDP